MSLNSFKKEQVTNQFVLNAVFVNKTNKQNQ